jgi:peptidase M28-like protein
MKIADFRSRRKTVERSGNLDSGRGELAVTVDDLSAEVQHPVTTIEPTQRRLREAVKGLSAIERRATTEGERRSAEWVAEELRAAGAHEVRLSRYNAHSTWAGTLVVHSAIALGASLAGGLISRAIAALAAVSLEADATGRSSWLRKLVPGKGYGTNVHARIPAAGGARHTVVVVAHHDAAHNGFVWHPRTVDAGRRIAARTGTTPSYMGLPVIAMLAVAAGPTLLRRVGQAVLGTTIALAVQSAFSKTVPGANDNASGVAGMLELGRRLAADPIDGLDVILLSPGGEEAGGVGIAGWLEQEEANLDPALTLFVGLDSIGSGEAVVSVRESMTGRYRNEDIQLVQRAADRAGLARPRRVGLGAISDPLVARYRGFRSVSLLSWRDGMIANLHRTSDVPANVDWASAERVTDVAYAVIGQWART